MAAEPGADNAPGRPGIDPTWTSSAKDMVSTALGSSRLWATFGYGIVNEVYWPSTGEPQIRDLGFIVAGPKGWAEVKRVQRYSISMPKPYVPLPTIVHRGDDYRLELECIVHPLRDALLIRYRLEGEGLKLYPLLSPHLGGERRENAAHAAADLTAHRGPRALCLRSDTGFARTSAGFVGVSDGWQDFNANGRMNWTYAQATGGNVALMGELENASGVLALAFNETLEGATTLARSSLADDYDDVKAMFVSQWEDWGGTLDIPHASPELKREAELSAAIIKMHEDRTYAGALVASLSVPWGNSRNDLGGYHLVWTRDAVEAAFALIAVGQVVDASRILAYLIGTQAEDGSWGQNYFPNGLGYWNGKQLDEVALPLLLVGKLRAIGSLPIAAPVEAMSRAAVGYILRNGPLTDQDRWEENAGLSPFTMGVAISALVAAATLLDPDEADLALSYADYWNERIEELLYTRDSRFCATHQVAGHFVRIAPAPADGGLSGTVPIRNTEGVTVAATNLVGMEFLALVRCGLRACDDPRIIETLKVVEAELRRDTPSGPAYHRYNGDGYGEHADGTPFDGTGIGRLWPLLTGERGHLAVAAGEDAHPYLDAMSRMTGPAGLIPEQIWDADAIPERGLFAGKPSGSAMPLVWAHAEYLKLLAAQADGRSSEALAVVEERYNRTPPRAPVWHWRQDLPFTSMPSDRSLSLDCREPFTISWQGSAGRQSRTSQPVAFGLHCVRLDPPDLPGGKIALLLSLGSANSAQAIEITFRSPD